MINIRNDIQLTSSKSQILVLVRFEEYSNSYYRLWYFMVFKRGKSGIPHSKRR